MSKNVSRTEWYENQLLRIVRIVLLFTMTLAIIIALVGGVYGGYKYFSPAQDPIPEKSPPSDAVSVQQFLDEIDPDKKKVVPKSEEVRKEEVKPTITTLKYLEETTRLYRCSFEFGRVVGVTMDEVDSAAASKQIEILRSFVERSANIEFRGDGYAKNLVDFVCTALSNQRLIEMRKSNKVQNVFVAAISFHQQAWDRIKMAESQFKREEAARYAKEKTESETVKMMEKAEGLLLLAAAGIAFVIFMCIAVYLIFSKIERNLRTQILK